MTNAEIESAIRECGFSEENWNVYIYHDILSKVLHTVSVSPRSGKVRGLSLYVENRRALDSEAIKGLLLSEARREFGWMLEVVNAIGGAK